MRRAALALLVLLPLPGLVPAGATVCAPADTQDPVLKGFFAEEFELSTTFALRHAWEPMFLLNATVEDDREVVLVWAEFIDLDTGWNFSVVLGNKQVLHKNSTIEESHWSVSVDKMRADIVEGAYEVVVRVHDACGNIFVTPEDSFEFEVEAGDGEYPLPAFPDTPDLSLAGREDDEDSCVDGEPVLLGPGAFLQANVTLGRLREVTYSIEYAPGQFTDPERLEFPYVVGQDILRPGAQNVTFYAHSRLLDEGTLTMRVCNVTVDTDPPVVENVLFESEDGTIYANLPFDIVVDVQEVTDHTIRIRAVGTTSGSQVGPFDGDVGQPVAPMTAAIRFLDEDASNSLTEADTFVLDSNGDRRTGPGDVILSGDMAGTILLPADFGPTDPRRPLITPVQPVDIRFIDTDGNGYDVGDWVFLDDTPGTGVDERALSRLDVWFSGDRFGRFAVEDEWDSEIRPLLDSPLSFRLLDNDGDGAPSQGDALYLASGSTVTAGDVRIVPGFRGRDIVGTSDGDEMENVFDPIRGVYVDRYTFAGITLPDVRTYKVTIEAQDALGNHAAQSIDLPVQAGYTKIRVTDLRVLNATPFPNQPVHFTASINQTDGVGEPLVLVAFQDTPAFDADGKTALYDGVRLPLKTRTQVSHDDTYLPGRHSMEVEVSVPEGLDVRAGSDLRRTVTFEVFMGRVDHDGDSYWIRANSKGLPGSAVLAPGAGEEVFDLFQKQVATANGTRAVWAFNTTAGELVWDPAQRNAQGQPVTTIEDAGTTTPKKDSPGLAALVLAALGLVALARRGRK